MSVIEAETTAVEAPATDMTTSDVANLLRYEAVIKRGRETFIEVGKALASIRDQRLYRGTHATFEEYCRDRWDIHRAYAYRLMDGAEVVANLSPIGDILPATESQARPLTKLEPEQQAAAWAEAVEDAGGKQPTAAQAEKAAAKYVEPKPVYAPVWELERKVSDWLADENAGGLHAKMIVSGSPVGAEHVLATVKASMANRVTGAWYDELWEWLQRRGVAFKKADLNQAINNVHEQARARARQAKLQASGKTVYDPPKPQPPAQPDPAKVEDAIVRDLLYMRIDSETFALALKIASVAQLKKALTLIPPVSERDRFRKVGDRYNLLLDAEDAAMVDAVIEASLRLLADPSPAGMEYVEAVRAEVAAGPTMPESLADEGYRLKRASAKSWRWELDKVWGGFRSEHFTDPLDAIKDAWCDSASRKPQPEAADTPDPDEAAATLEVAAEREQEDAERAQRDSERQAFERVAEVFDPEPVEVLPPSTVTLAIATDLLQALHADLMAHYPGRKLSVGQRHTLAGILYAALGGESWVADEA